VLSVIDGELGVEGSPTHFNHAVVELVLSDEIIYVHLCERGSGSTSKAFEFPLRLCFFMQHHLLSLTLTVHLQHQ
jgi:hypothetical protein